MRSESPTATALTRPALALMTLLSAAVAQAGSFSVTPVRLFFEPRDRAVAVTLTNDGDSEIALQADVNRWTQEADGTDKLELSDDLIISPPSLKLAPKSKQVVRLALTTPRDMAQQMTYRLIVREVPEAVANKDSAVQLPIALVLSMPVFITPPNGKRQVACEMGKSPTRALEAVCQNTGNVYAQVRGVELRRGESVLARFEGGTYLLQGVRRALGLKPEGAAAPPPGAAELVVKFDDARTQSFAVELP